MHPVLATQATGASDSLGQALLLIVSILFVAFALPFAMAWLEPRPQEQPRHRSLAGDPAPAAELRIVDRTMEAGRH